MRPLLAKAMAKTASNGWSKASKQAAARRDIKRINALFTHSGKLVKRLGANLAEIRARLLRLHQSEDWKALGYSSWRACVVAEFDASQRTLYNELAAAQIERECFSVAMLQNPPIPATKLLILRQLDPEDRPEVANQLFRDGDNPTLNTVQGSVLDRLRSSTTPRAEKVALAREEAARQRARAERGETRAKVRHAIPMEENYALGLKDLERAIDRFTRAGRHAIKIDVEHAKGDIELHVLKILSITNPLVDRWLPDYRAKRRKPA